MKKRKIEIIASVESYENLSTFKSIDELNETVRNYKEEYKDELNKTDIELLNILHSYSAKHTGVSFLTKNKIAKLLNCTRRTVVRKCNKLESLGIIKQYETKRKSDMQQTSNAIVILPIQVEVEEVMKVEKTKEKEQNVTQDSAKMSHQKNNISLKQIHNIKHLNMINTASSRKAYVKLVPKRLQQYQAFFGNKIKSLYGRVWLAMKNLEVQIEQSIMQEIAHIAFDKLVEYLKQGRNMSTEDMHKIAYKIAYNQLSEREDTKDLVNHQKAINKALFLKSKFTPQQHETPSLNLFKEILNG